MSSVHLHKRVRHKPEEMLALVTDVEAYPEFINFVSAVRVMDRKPISNGIEQFKADIGVQYKFVSERFRSIVKIDHNSNALEIGRSGHGGAVRELSNTWKFIELGDGSSLIDFKLGLRMKAPPLEFLIRQKFEITVNHIVNVFEIRAGQVYPVIGAEDYDFSTEKASIS